MGRYCCFVCPSEHREDREITDECPSCSRTYEFPLLEYPKSIGDYKVVRPLNRGFYGATYLVEKKGIIDTEVVVKLSPKLFYEFFDDKDFEMECQIHAKVAQDTDHIVRINDRGEVLVNFSDIEIECYYAELNYEDGPVLAEYLNESLPISAQMVAQISIDLFRLQNEFRVKNVYHNDLHAENIIIKPLQPSQFRADAIDGSIRAIAIDLGSVQDYSKSDTKQEKFGDLHWICSHINKLISCLLDEPETNEDIQYRLVSRLQYIFQLLASDVENQRTPNVVDLIEEIRDAYYSVPRHAWKPWDQPLRLRDFGASYNAQTLHPWHVPLLLVDDDEWLNKITTPGPQVVVGMRGCGKTLFLRAVQFHARASKIGQFENESEVFERVKNDHFLGLFVSAQRLLDAPAVERKQDFDPFPRLFVSYLFEAVRAVLHLQDIDDSQVYKSAPSILASVCSDYMTTNDVVGSIDSLEELDLKLEKLLVEVSRETYEDRLKGHPSAAFISLARAVKRSAKCWENVQVLFLLDDVSTRYLTHTKIGQLLSALVFQDTDCAFKMTSEIQVMELGLKTPGQIHPVREGRDLSVFDLGSEVYRRIKSPKGKIFVEEILSRRAQQFAAHPNHTPSSILGDCNLESIAREIASSSQTSKNRKQVYRGLSALSHVCVGDIGDVISLYERIISCKKGGGYPVKANLQSECFQDHCSHRLYDLNRRGSELNDVAKSFSEASHELLVKSYRESKKSNKKLRLRQYALIYVRVTTGEFTKQISRLRELIDAGVFVFAGGSPRTKTKDSDPIHQFKLTFRRIYGLSNFIGLAERDRFELSGKDLEDWLNHPENGKEILLRNLGGGIECNETDSSVDFEENEDPSRFHPKAIDLFESEEAIQLDYSNVEELGVMNRKIDVQKLNLSQLGKGRINAIVLGLGFEERTLHSAKKLLAEIDCTHVYAVRYPEKGMSDKILEEASRFGKEVSIIDSSNFSEIFSACKSSSVLIDITGLTKQMIFSFIKRQLTIEKEVYVVHTAADLYYPTDSELAQLVSAQEDHNRSDFFRILSNIVTGEEKPYDLIPLIDSDADQTRKRVLFAFASSKHERLLSLLDQREFDRVEILAPAGSGNRNRVASEIASIAASDNSNSRITKFHVNDLEGTISYFLQGFEGYYVQLGANVEFGLTGSKLQAVSAAAVSSIRKITQAWYVKPQKFDPDRFTVGQDSISYFRLSVVDKD